MSNDEHSILHEIRQAQPFSTPAQEATVALMRTADVVRRRIAATMEPFGITTQQYNVLRILRGAGEGGLPTLEIAQRMIEEAPGITRLLDRIEKKGWVKRRRCAEDRRQVLVSITPEGLALLAAMDEAVLAADNGALGSISDADLRVLMRVMDRIRNPPA
ncbi:MAG: MarR family transcriptional regulator [Gemmatimonadetes bacterium]|nr:MarR family transcriptional regulator [Gemmatimonadota bacterium]